MLIWYRNSFLASVVSIIGSGAAIMAVTMLFSGEILTGIVFGAIAAGLLYLGKKISEQKSFDKWWKQVEKANLEPEIRRSRDLAVEVYKKNPEPRTLEKIRSLNPDAARYIQNGFKEPAASVVTPKPQITRTAPPVQQTYQPPVQQQTYQPPVQQSTYQPPVYQQTTSGTGTVRRVYEKEFDSIDELIDDVAKTANENTNHDPDIYWQCYRKLDMLVNTFPDHERLLKNVATLSANYASYTRTRDFSERKRAYYAALRSLTVEKKKPDSEVMDVRRFYLIVHAVHGAIQAVNSEDISAMEEALEWLRGVPEYWLVNPDERDVQYKNVAVPSVWAYLTFYLAKRYLAQSGANKKKARDLLEEGLRICPFALIRQCDLNPNLNTDLETVLTRERMMELWRSTAE